MFSVDIPIGRLWLCIDPFRKCAENLSAMFLSSAQASREAYKIQDEVKRLAIRRRMHEG